ncbi:MAG: flagellar basal body M-ring protein FliF, partial [Ideonella sp.]
ALAPPPPPEPVDLQATGRGGQLDAVVDDATALPGMEGGLPALEAPTENSKLEAARQLARDNPGAVANIMREWVTGEVAA